MILFNLVLIRWNNVTYTYNLDFRFNRLISNVKKVVYNEHAFAVLKKDGTVVVWGRETHGGDASAIQSNLTDIVDIYPNRYLFVAINSSYNLYGWGGTRKYQIANLDATITDVSSVVVNHNGYAFFTKKWKTFLLLGQQQHQQI